MQLDLLRGPQAFVRRRRALDRAAVALYETTTRSASGRTLARVHEREWSRLSEGQRDLFLESLVATILSEASPVDRAAGTPAPTVAAPPRRAARRAARRRSRRQPTDGPTLAALAASAFGPFSVIALPWGFLALPQMPDGREPEDGPDDR